MIPEIVVSKLKLKLLPSCIKLVDSNRNNIECLCGSHVQVCHHGDNCKAKVYVTKNNVPLLGSDFIQKLRNVNLNSLLTGKIETSISSVDSILASYAEVYNDKPYDKVLYRKAQLVMKADAKPKFFPPRLVPLAIKPLVEAEIDRLVKIGFWTPITESQ